MNLALPPSAGTANPMQAVFNAPVRQHGFHDPSGIAGQTADLVAGLDTHCPVDSMLGAYHPHRPPAFPLAAMAHLVQILPLAGAGSVGHLMASRVTRKHCSNAAGSSCGKTRRKMSCDGIRPRGKCRNRFSRWRFAFPKASTPAHSSAPHETAQIAITSMLSKGWVMRPRRVGPAPRPSGC